MPARPAKLRYGLNIRTKAQSRPPPSAKGDALFGEADSAHEIAAPPPSKASTVTPTIPAAAHVPPTEDPSVYAYDEVYDQMKQAERQKLAQARGDIDSTDYKPRYLANLKKAAETRKKDLLRAEDRMIQRERQAEGDEFADKEKFVTTAYKEQQAELRRLEQEEKLREEEEARRMKHDRHGFYRHLMANTEAAHEAAVKASLEASVAKKSSPGAPSSASKEESAMERRIREAEHEGRTVVRNEDGEVIDKRDLLAPGLNIMKLKRRSPSPEKRRSYRDGRDRPDVRESGRGSRREDQRARMSRQIEKQIREAEKRSREEDQRKESELAEKLARRNADHAVAAARARYLARKQAAAAAAAASKGSEA